MLISGVFLLVLSGVSRAEHPALMIMKRHAADRADITEINPYIVSIFALDDVEQNRHLDEVQQFILWYFSSLNYPDRNGLTGTIYDYVLENGKEQSTTTYDSVDGYAGMFLHLLSRYALKTGDLDVLRNNWTKIEDIAYLLPFLQDSNGLTRALPGGNEQYLMDNSEAYAGISAYLKLRKLLHKHTSPYYNLVRSNIKKAIFAQLYESRNRIFSWAVADNQRSFSDWNRFYPDAYAQLFPVYFGLLADRPHLKRHLWNEFVRRYAGQSSGFPAEQRTIYELTGKTMEGKIP